MNIASLDLNLLVSLDALLRERGVTRAAQKLGLSQPALSGALGRLRRHFGDELLVRSGNTYRLTPLAVQLAERTAIALAGVERVFGAQAQFDPAQCTREFTVLVSDYGLAVLGSRLVETITRRAPHAQVRFLNHQSSDIDHASERLRTVDALMLPHGFVVNLPHQNLYRDRWTLVVSKDNTAVGESVTLAQLAELPWVMTYHEPTAYTPAGRQLELLGVVPRIQVVADGFLAVAGLVAGSGRVALLQERLVHALPSSLGIRAVPCPFDAVPLTEALWWHPVSDHDPEHHFLRQAAREAAATLAVISGSDSGG